MSWSEIAIPSITGLAGVVLGGWMSRRQTLELASIQSKDDYNRLLLELQYDKVMEFIRLSNLLAAWPAVQLTRSEAQAAMPKLTEQMIEWQAAKSYIFSLGVDAETQVFWNAVLQSRIRLVETFSKSEHDFQVSGEAWANSVSVPFQALVKAILDRLHSGQLGKHSSVKRDS